MDKKTLVGLVIVITLIILEIVLSILSFSSYTTKIPEVVSPDTIKYTELNSNIVLDTLNSLSKITGLPAKGISIILSLLVLLVVQIWIYSSTYNLALTVGVGVPLFLILKFLGFM